MQLKFFLSILSLLIISLPAAGWPCYTVSGKGNSICKPALAQSLQDLVKGHFATGDYDIDTAKVAKNQQIEVNYIGDLNGRKIYDLIYPIADNYYHYLKVIAVEQEANQYIPFYFHLSDYPRNNIHSSYIIPDKNLAASQIEIPGSGGNRDDFYLYIDPKTHTPSKIDIAKAYDILNQKIPKGYLIAKSAAFDIATLNIQSPLWKPTDSAACPSGGFINLQFELVNGVLQLKAFNYKPDQTPSNCC